MAVTVDAKCVAVTEIAAVTGTTGVTSTNLTVGGSATALLVSLCFDGSVNLSSFAVNWDATSSNVPLTQIGSTVYVSTVGQIALFGLVNPVAGAKTLKCTWSGTGTGYMASMSFIGTDTSSVANAFTNFVSATPTGSSGSFNCTGGASGNFAFAVNGNDNVTYTTFITSGGATALYTDANQNYSGAAYVAEAGATTNFTWAQGSSNQNVVAGVTVSVPAGTSVSVTGAAATGAAGSLALTTNTYANRVSFSTATTGTGTVNIGSAPSLYQLPTVAEVISGTQVGYTIVDNALWEVGTGVYTSSSVFTLARSTIESSTFGAGIPISLDGFATVFFVVTAAMFTGTAALASPAFTGIPTAPTASTSTNTTQTATTAFAAPAYNSVGSNKIHNPLFNVAQRGAGAFAATGYTLDRWGASVSTDTVSITQASLADADRSAIGDEEAFNSLQNVFTGNSGTAFNAIYQRIENLRRLSNKTVTVSFWAIATSIPVSIGISIDQYMGTGGTPSANVLGNGVAIPLSTTWARYQATFTLGSTLGLTLGSNNDHASQVNFWFSSGATQAMRAGYIGVQSATIKLWGVQLEIDSFASPLEKPDLRYDTSNCQRFYQVGNFSYNGYTSTGIVESLPMLFPVPMRAAPSVTPTFGTQTNCASSTTTGITANGFSPQTTGSSTAAFSLVGSFTATADL